MSYVNTDELIPDLVGRGLRPHPNEGWLEPVTAAVVERARVASAVSIEATGAWESDWQLPDRLAEQGLLVRRIWVWAPLDRTLERLHARSFPSSVSDEEVRYLHEEATKRARRQTFDLVLDTSARISHADVLKAVGPLIAG